MLQLTQCVDNNALLTYSLTTAPAPVQVSPQQGPPSLASLTFVISCPESVGSVTVSRITFNLQVGDPTAPDATDLTDTAAGLLASVASTDPTQQWQIGPGASAGVFVLSPVSGSAVIESQGLTVNFTGIQVSQLVGTAVVHIVELATADGPPPQPRQCSVAVPKFPYGFYFTDFSVGTPQVPLGQSVTLTWEGSSNASYALLYADQSVDVTNLRSWTSPPLYTTTAFILKVTAIVNQQTVSLSLSLTVTVAAPRIVTFKATPDCVDYNQSVVLSWRSVNADGVYLLTGESGRESLQPNSDPNNPLTITPRYGVHYYLQAYTQSGEVSQEWRLAITFNPLQIVSFTATPPAIDVNNQSVTLAWNVAHAVSVTLQGQVVLAQGDCTVSPAVTTTYELAAKWVDGTVTQQELTVPVLKVKFNGVTGSFALNGEVVTVTLTSQVENATSGRAGAWLCFSGAGNHLPLPYIPADGFNGQNRSGPYPAGESADLVKVGPAEWQCTFTFQPIHESLASMVNRYTNVGVLVGYTFDGLGGDGISALKSVMWKGDIKGWLSTTNATS